MSKPVQQPRDWTYCSACDRSYGFIKCRVTLNSPHRNICLGCAVEEEAHGTLRPLPTNLFSTMDPENQDAAPAEEITESPAEAPAEATEEAAE